jgi:hypothetical protein
MKQLNKAEFLELFDPSIHQAILDNMKRYPDATAMVCFENLQLDSSRCGARSALVVGPSNTFKSVEFCQGKWLHDLPSQRQYPTSWASREDLLR